ncbi:hypothetical protein ACFW04_002543 [Cataglyphis niger]
MSRNCFKLIIIYLICLKTLSHKKTRIFLISEFSCAYQY